MKLNLSTLAFGSIIEKGGGTPSWGTELGQSKPDYKFTVDGCEEILVGMLYNSVNLHHVSLPLGKGGHVDIASNFEECHLAAVFRKVYINGIRIGYPFIMVLIKELSASHTGRRSIKYSDKISYNFSVSNNKTVDDKVNVSHVKVNYEILISTYHFIPLNIELYKKTYKNYTINKLNYQIKNGIQLA